MKILRNQENAAIHGSVSCTKDGACTRYFLSDTDGSAEMRFYQVFPGISLVYEEIHTETCAVQRRISSHMFEIHHCRKGRMEGNAQNDYFYMEPGDMSICKPQSGCATSRYPLHHYHGITVMIDVEKTPRCLSCFLEDVNIEPKSLMEKFCKGSGVFIARSMPSIAHVFDELYLVPESIRTGYLKVKILELMLFLTRIDLKSDELEGRCFTPNQKRLAENVSAYLQAHMDQKITLEHLADIFHVSGTQIKRSIRGVYGTSLYTMIRIQKMQSAAKLLQQTDLTILEIAGRYGYDNASKFAGAFKTVVGVTPKAYRHRPVKIEDRFTGDSHIE